MIYDHFFCATLAWLHQERRYCVFADLERIAGRFPHAIWHSPGGPRPVVIWCSNDYLGMGQPPKVIGAMVETTTRMGAGAGGASGGRAAIEAGQVRYRGPGCRRTYDPAARTSAASSVVSAMERS